MIINLICIFKNKYVKINIIFFSVQLIFMIFSLFMTYYLKNAYLLIIGNKKKIAAKIIAKIIIIKM